MHAKFIAWCKAITEVFFILLLAVMVRTFGYGLYKVPSGSMETTMLVGELFFADKLTYLFSRPKYNDIIAFSDPEYAYSHHALNRWVQKRLWGPDNITKRVIGLPGDEIKGEVVDGTPIIKRNGEIITEDYVNKYPLIRLVDETQEFDFDDLTMTYTGYFQTYDPTKSFDQQPFYSINARRLSLDKNNQPIIRRPGTTLTRLAGREKKDNGQNYYDGSDEFHVRLKDNEYWVMGDNRLNSYDSRAFGPLKGDLIHSRVRYRIVSLNHETSWMAMIFSPIAVLKDKVRWDRTLVKLV